MKERPHPNFEVRKESRVAYCGLPGEPFQDDSVFIIEMDSFVAGQVRDFLAQGMKNSVRHTLAEAMLAHLSFLLKGQ